LPCSKLAEFRTGVMRAFREGAVAIPLGVIFSTVQIYLLVPFEQRMHFSTDVRTFADLGSFIVAVVAMKAAANRVTYR